VQPLQDVDKVGKRFAYPVYGDPVSTGDPSTIGVWHWLVEGNADCCDQTFSCTRRDTFEGIEDKGNGRKRKKRDQGNGRKRKK
jgi:hypothetical protein